MSSREELLKRLEPFAQGCFSGNVSEWSQLKPLLRDLYCFLSWDIEANPLEDLRRAKEIILGGGPIEEYRPPDMIAEDPDLNNFLSEIKRSESEIVAEDAYLNGILRRGNE